MLERLIPSELSAMLNHPEKDKELVEMARSIDWRNPSSGGERYLFAREVVRQAEDLVRLLDPTPLMLSSRSYDRDVTNIKFRNVVGYEARTVTAGGYKETIRIDKEYISMPIPRKYEHVSIEVLKEDLMVATYADIGTIREGIAEALLRKKINLTWAALCDGITHGDRHYADGTTATGGVPYAGPSTGNYNYIAMGGASLTEAALNHAIDHVDSYGGGVYSIIGHPSKVNIINDFTGFRAVWPEQAKLDYWRLGFLGIYRGGKIVKIPLTYDAKYNAAPMNKTNVFIMGAGMGEIANIYGVESETWDIPQRDVQIISAQEKYIILTWRPEGGFKIVTT